MNRTFLYFCPTINRTESAMMAKQMAGLSWYKEYDSERQWADNQQNNSSACMARKAG